MGLKKKNGITYCISELLSEYDFIEHLFTTRGDNFNIGLHVGDEEKNVLANRAQMCSLLEINPEDLVAGEQIHQANIYQVAKKDLGKGARSYASSLKGIDGLVTNIKGIPLLAFYADCTPIYLLDPVKKAIGLFHGGLKGTLLNIAGKGVQTMQELYNTEAEDIVAFIGPRIDSCCYQVGSEIREQLIKIGKNHEPYIDKDNFLSLPLINQSLLQEAGVEKIEISPFCTSCSQQLFFSYRKENGKTGRMGAVFMIK